MRLRRCSCVWLEPRLHWEVDLSLLLGPSPRLESALDWYARAPHLEREVRLEAEDVIALGRISPSDWTEREPLADVHGAATIDRLHQAGLLVADDDGDPAAAADAALRGLHWHGLSAAAHRHLRWQGVDIEKETADWLEVSGGVPLDHLGAPPPPVLSCLPAHERIALPEPAPSALDALLDRRVTCRNFDAQAGLRRDDLGAILRSVFGARAEAAVTGVPVLKKGAPSAGGLHPTEAYLLIRRADGVAPGLYHYHVTAHALEPLRDLTSAEADDLALRFVAVQRYFADAPVLVLYVSRFARNFWKYRGHAKAYRATVLDVGHLSQTLYLAATERGLGAFFTAAVNEIDIEQAFGLDPMEQGVIGVGGFGHRGTVRREIEFDPLHAVWPD
jgi:putative peptide maturation dehydrogenase